MYEVNETRRIEHVCSCKILTTNLPTETFFFQKKCVIDLERKTDFHYKSPVQIFETYYFQTSVDFGVPRKLIFFS